MPRETWWTSDPGELAVVVDHVTPLHLAVVVELVARRRWGESSNPPQPIGDHFENALELAAMAVICHGKPSQPGEKQG